MPTRPVSFFPVLAGLALAVSGSAHAMDAAALATLVDQRLAGDRTGACMAVAVIDKGEVARAFRCADPTVVARIGPDSAFEIGSVTKTMTSTLLADLIVQGKASLDDPLAAYLPGGTAVPQFEGAPILLRHVVTHTSGLPALPARMAVTNPADPYAALTVDDLLASLGDVTLARAPGTQFEYSNFASMVLSYAVARRAGSDFETLLRQGLLAPLGMDTAYIGQRPEGVRSAGGHTPNGLPAAAWTFPVDLAGVGGVRATLDDMVRYVQANLDPSGTPLEAAVELAQTQINQQPPMAMNWMIMPMADRSVLAHEGGTGGFSSFVSLDKTRRRGVVILSDTNWNSIGGLGSLGLHLVDASFPLGEPRVLVAPSQALLDGLVGEYQLQGMMKMSLRQRDGKLFAQAEGQGEFELFHDSAGDFFPTVVDAVLRPRKEADGGYAFTWMQGGGAIPAKRIEAAGEDAKLAQQPTASDGDLAAYAGEYTLMPDFVLTVRGRDGTLHAQATGQGEFPLQARGNDTFEAPAFGVEIVFKRGAGGSVESLELHQGGQVLPGKRN
ncbi:serine hydrolase [Luteimonas sp. MJ250]|uniref:serine hydrolase n=1 Tax=Luteimonas sp. MJ250 TaxID=3129236 RepID=UPI0031BACF92